jgi:hypothetical protein
VCPAARCRAFPHDSGVSDYAARSGISAVRAERCVLPKALPPPRDLSLRRRCATIKHDRRFSVRIRLNRSQAPTEAKPGGVLPAPALARTLPVAQATPGSGIRRRQQPRK